MISDAITIGLLRRPGNPLSSSGKGGRGPVGAGVGNPGGTERLASMLWGLTAALESPFEAPDVFVLTCARQSGGSMEAPLPTTAQLGHQVQFLPVLGQPAEISCWC